MALAPVDLLASIIAMRATHLRRLHRLAIDDPRRWAGLAPFSLARQRHQSVIDRQPRALIAPKIEVVLHRREGWKILGQHAPSAAALGDIEDRLHHAAQRGLAGSTPPRGRW